MIKILRKYNQSINRFNLLFFISGILTGLLIYFYSESNYEDKIFEALASNVLQHSQTKDSKGENSTILVNSLHIVHNSIINRQGLFNNITGIKAGIIHPVTVDLMTGNESCGSYALVLARLVKELGFDVRMVQMQVDGEFGGHILVEAKNHNNWIVLDPSYDLYFKCPNGEFASFKDVQSDWNFYKQQVPENYDLRYKYEGLRYTNWNKIPVVMPAIKKILDWTIGKEKSDTFSFRTIVLRKFNLFFFVTLIIQLCVFNHMIYYAYKKRLRLKKSLGHLTSDDILPDSAKKAKIKVVKLDEIAQLKSVNP